jgi:hypothetical protein
MLHLLFSRSPLTDLCLLFLSVFAIIERKTSYTYLQPEHASVSLNMHP